MKFSFTSKWKIWVIITLAIVVVGMAFLGIFGLNNTPDFKESYEIEVSLDQNINGVADNLKSSAETYFSENLRDTFYSDVQEIEDNKFIYKFSSLDWKDGASVEGLIEAMEDAVDNSELVVSAECREVVPHSVLKTWKIIIALAVAVVLGFILLAITEKVRSALVVSAVSIISAILTLSLFAITRVPVKPQGLVLVIITYLVSFILSSGIVDRFNEIKKIAGNEKMPNEQVADKGVLASIVRVTFVCGAMLIATISLLILGSLTLKFIGLGLFIATIVSAFSALTITPILYVALKK